MRRWVGRYQVPSSRCSPYPWRNLHFDHAAALTRWDELAQAVPTFPNAKVVVQQTEWEDALAKKSTMTRTCLRSHLDPIADPVLFPGLAVWPMVGHTWDQQAVRFDDGEGIVCFPGDVMPTIHHVRPSFRMGHDMMPYENMRSKQRLLTRAVDEGWRLVLDHEPGSRGQRCPRGPAPRSKDSQPGLTAAQTGHRCGSMS